MATIAEKIRNVRAHVPASVTLVCVSKFHPVEVIREAYEAGERDFGESRVQELKRKIQALPQDIRWHFIGHLQTNKVRELLRLRPYLIQSVDSERLLRAIQEEAAQMGIVQDVLLELHVALEATKSGFTPDELAALTQTMPPMPNIRIRGLMTMATHTDDETEIRRCFAVAADCLNDKMVNNQMVNGQMVILSMGMSDDYRIAISCGSTMIRIGSTIFGERTQPTLTSLPKAFFFDQDGVLFDSMTFHAKSYSMAMAEYGLTSRTEDVYRNEGRTGVAVISEALRLLHTEGDVTAKAEEIYEVKKRYFNQLTGGQLPPLIPGISELLGWLHDHGTRCWVVTGSGQHSLIDRITATFPGIFTGLITAFDVTHGKPDPEPYLRAWERSELPKTDCAVVENAPLGIRAAKAAGLFTIAVNTGILPDEALLDEHPDLLFHDMNSLLQYLCRLVP